MPDQYVTATEVKGFIGGDVYDAIDAYTDITPLTHIEAATASVQSAMRNSGYAAGSTTTDVTVKNAVIALTWWTMAKVPEANLSLPDDWENNHLWQAWIDIYTGKASLEATPDNTSAVGGNVFSETNTDVDSGARSQRTSRTELKGY